MESKQEWATNVEVAISGPVCGSSACNRFGIKKSIYFLLKKNFVFFWGGLEKLHDPPPELFPVNKERFKEAIDLGRKGFP